MTSVTQLGILGGGLAGLSLALTLSKLPQVRVHLFERKAAPDLSESVADQAYLNQYDARSIALASGSVELLTQLGVWQSLSSHAAPIRQIQIYRKGAWGRSRIMAAQEQVEALGYVLQAPLLASHLFKALWDQGSTQLHWQTSVEKLRPKVGGYQVIGTDVNGKDSKQDVDLLVIADGLASKGASLLGIERTLVNYGQSALVTNLNLSQSLDGVALECFTSQGVIALLPLPAAEQESYRAALVWVSAKDAPRLEAISEAAFMAELEAAIGARYKIISIGKRKSYPLSGSISQTLVRPNLILMGSAAVGLHPVAAQGFNLALRDVKAISNLLKQHQPLSGADFNFELLNRYETERLKDHQRVRGFIEVLLKTYAGSGAKLPSALQGLGLLCFDTLPGVKKALAQFAMGAKGSASTSVQMFNQGRY